MMNEDFRKERWYRSIRLTILLAKVYVLVAIAGLLYLLVGPFFGSSGDSVVFVELASQIKGNTSGVKEKTEQIENGIHVPTGLIYAEGFDLVRNTCTGCHSAQLITQNRATRTGWQSMIRWMQKTQGLWELGDNEGPILDYLATHYAPEEVGRRANLDVEAIEWYVLELE
jgi:hypothetical protein